MAPFTSLLLSFVLAASVISAPIHKARQLGDLQCNVDRLSIINQVSKTQSLISEVQNANSTLLDLPTQSALAVAQTGLEQVNLAVQTILDAALQNQTAPAASRDQVSDGLDAALEGLQSASKTIQDSGLNATIADAISSVIQAGQDGNNVVADCK
uniref:Cell wall protein n=1 Tax=Mycena chlorophos TaxID=658473 RepID=A0ABQ0LTB1_MYCCL|nr:predicted protein [Mycena chlorophos]